MIAASSLASCKRYFILPETCNEGMCPESGAGPNAPITPPAAPEAEAEVAHDEQSGKPDIRPPTRSDCDAFFDKIIELTVAEAPDADAERASMESRRELVVAKCLERGTRVELECAVEVTHAAELEACAAKAAPPPRTPETTPTEADCAALADHTVDISVGSEIDATQGPAARQETLRECLDTWTTNGVNCAMQATSLGSVIRCKLL